MNKLIYILVTPFFPSPGRWKYGYGYDFAKALIDTGKYDVRVFMPYAHGGRDHGGALTDEDYEIKGIRVYRFKEKRLPSNVFPFLFRRYNERSFLAKVRSVLSIQQGDADSLVHLHPTSSVALSEGGSPSPQILTSVKICHAHTANYANYPLALKRLNPTCLTLLHHHDLQSFGLGMGVLRTCWLYNMMVFPIFRHYHEQIDCHVFISDLSRRSFLSAPDTGWTSFAPYKKQMRGLPYRPVCIKRSIILHNGVDTSMFKAEGRRNSEKVRTGSDPFVIGCIGNFIECKDQITLIRAVGVLAKQGISVKCIFIGTDVLLDACKQEAESIVHLHLSPSPTFEFRTELPHDELPGFYRSIDLFVLPSYFEGFGCVYAESWCCGTPFIACRGSAMEELLPADEHDKWLCKEHDPKDLARLMQRYYFSRDKQHLKTEVAIGPLVDKFIGEL